MRGQVSGLSGRLVRLIRSGLRCRMLRLIGLIRGRSRGCSRMIGRLGLMSVSGFGMMRLRVAVVRVGVLIVHAGQSGLIEVTVIAAVLDPGRVIHAHDVLLFVVRDGEPRVRQEPPGDGVGRQFGVAGTLEPDDLLLLTLAFVDLIRIGANGVFGAVSLTPLTGGFVGHAGGALEKGQFAALALGVDTVLVQTSGAGDGRIVVGSVAALLFPVVVVVAVIMDIAVAGVDKAVGASLFSQGAVSTLE